MQDYRKLRVWQSSYALGLDIYRVTGRFPGEERYRVVDQMRRAALSIPANIAEGSGRSSNRDFARFLHFAFGSANELECYLCYARDLGYVDVAESRQLLGDVARIKRMLNSLLPKLRTKNQ